MKLEEIRITPDNWHEYSGEYHRMSVMRRQIAVDVHSDIDRFFNSVLGTGEYWGGLYHDWLDKFGIKPEENGWWSRDAVNRENIESFVEYQLNGDEGLDTLLEALDKIKRLRYEVLATCTIYQIKETIREQNDNRREENMA